MREHRRREMIALDYTRTFRPRPIYIRPGIEPDCPERGEGFTDWGLRRLRLAREALKIVLNSYSVNRPTRLRYRPL